MSIAQLHKWLLDSGHNSYRGTLHCFFFYTLLLIERMPIINVNLISREGQTEYKNSCSFRIANIVFILAYISLLRAFVRVEISVTSFRLQMLLCLLFCNFKHILWNMFVVLLVLWFGFLVQIRCYLILYCFVVCIRR